MRTGMGLAMVGLFALANASEAEWTKPNPFFLTSNKRTEVFPGLVQFEALARKKLNYYGGRVLGSPKVYAVMWGSNVNPETQNHIGDMLASTLNSSYLDMLKQYGTNISSALGAPGTKQAINRGSFAGTIMIQPSNASTDLQDADVGAEIERQIESGALPKPDSDTAYFMFFPPGISISLDGAKSCEVFCGYHHSVATRSFGQVYFSVQPDLGGACATGCGGSGSDLDNMTTVTSHELTEIITDPGVEANVSALGPPIAWVTSQGSEIGDVCASELTTLTTASGMQYQLQQAFDNSIGACNRGPFRSP